tara:strand:- start:1453 stop:2094 length:642 start_codon:yes stop_codon:yes gene_type:complete
MTKKIILPNTIPVFPLSNFILFPQTSVPLNIFEPRYIQMVDDAMKGERIIGMVQPKRDNNLNPALYEVGCASKISGFNETDDGRYLIIINGISRFKIKKEIDSNKKYRKCNINFKEYSSDLIEQKESINFSDLKLIFKNFKVLFDRMGYQIDWKQLEKESVDKTINALSMTAPFTPEEKQILLETISIAERKEKLKEILKTYLLDNFSNTTIQ